MRVDLKSSLSLYLCLWQNNVLEQIEKFVIRKVDEEISISRGRVGIIYIKRSLDSSVYMI